MNHIGGNFIRALNQCVAVNFLDLYFRDPSLFVQNDKEEGK